MVESSEVRGLRAGSVYDPEPYRATAVERTSSRILGLMASSLTTSTSHPNRSSRSFFSSRASVPVAVGTTGFIASRAPASWSGTAQRA